MFMLADLQAMLKHMSDKGHEGSAIMFMLGLTQVYLSISMWELFSDSLQTILGTTGAAFVFVAVFFFIQEKRIKKWKEEHGYDNKDPNSYIRDRHGNITGIQEKDKFLNLKMMAIWAATLFFGFPIIF